MPTFKELHTKWKEVKKEVKMAWDHLDRMTADFSSAHSQVKFALVRYPAFAKGMGPALDTLHELTNKKDVKEKDLAKHKEALKKQKSIVTEAVQVYKSDVDPMRKCRTGVSGAWTSIETETNKVKT